MRSCEQFYANKSDTTDKRTNSLKNTTFQNNARPVKEIKTIIQKPYDQKGPGLNSFIKH